MSDRDESDEPDARAERADESAADESTADEERTDDSGDLTDRLTGDDDGGGGLAGDDDGGGLSGGLAVLVSAIVALAVTGLVYWWVGGWAGNEVFVEELYRVAPTVGGGGVGADWVAGNTVPWLDALIAIVHAADVLMGVFILVMVFLHWAAFRRLAGRMRRPAGSGERGAVATDGGEQTEGGDRR